MSFLPPRKMTAVVLGGCPECHSLSFSPGEKLPATDLTFLSALLAAAAVTLKIQNSHYFHQRIGSLSTKTAWKTWRLLHGFYFAESQ